MRHQDDYRLISAGELEGLLAWWRTTACDPITDEPRFCQHGQHSRAPCEECAANRSAA